MENWQSHLPVDPLPHLLSSQNEALTYFVTRDLLHRKVPPLETVWRSKNPIKILTKQQENGSWTYPGKTKSKYPDINYDLLETFRNTAILVEKYGFTDEHPAIQKSADYLFSCQTEEGDFRGIYGKEYAPNYSAAIMTLLRTKDKDLSLWITLAVCRIFQRFYT